MTEDQAQRLKRITDKVIQDWNVQKALQMEVFNYEVSDAEIETFIERMEE